MPILFAHAQGTGELKTLQQIDALEQAKATLEKIDAQLDAVVRARKLQCTMAVGYAPFCDCIMKDMPVAWSFQEYVAITTNSKAVNGYDKMDPQLKSAYDMVAPIRDKCVKQINARR